MIHVDESDPVGEVELSFPCRNVTIKRGIDAKEIYELVTEIGRGKFGTVYKCKEKATGLKLAAKFVPIPKREDRRNVEREVEIMNSLQHSLITQLYDALEYQKMMCVVLELVEGGELFDRVIDDDFVLTEKACVVFIRQVCQAMEFVHRNKIIHLDLKPENILCLTREGNRIKIIDFGLARKYDPDKKLQVLFGTPEFVAPEVVNFDQITYGTDMWSVGVICYVLLSGLSPFMGATDIETMANVTIGKFDFDDEAFASVSKESLEFISKLLVKDTSLRMTASECIEHIWLKRRPKPQVAPKPVVVPPARYKTPPLTPQVVSEDEGIIGTTIIHLPVAAAIPVVAAAAAVVVGADDELKTTKDNLKSFIERWEEHPNSPYVFDIGSNRISPVTQLGVDDDEKRNGGSGLSSRGCSPSPCGSVYSELPPTIDDEIPPTIAATIPSTNDDLNENPDVPPQLPEQMQPPNELFQTNDHGHKRQFKEYLQSFERRNSDSNCILTSNPNSDKVNLADEIKKLSERLMMLSSINCELNDYNEQVENNPQDAPVNHTPVHKEKPAIKEKPDFLKNRTKAPKLSDSFNRSLSSETSKLSNSTTTTTNKSRTFTRASSVINTNSNSFQSNTMTSSSRLTNGLSERLRTLDEMPNIYNKMENIRKVSQNINIKQNTFIDSTKSSTSPPSANFLHGGGVGGGNAPWTVNRRTKFRITQMSRDVPLGSPNTHQTVFLEEAVNTTKDCLLHLLDKYNEAETRSAYSNTGRHQSMSVCMDGLTDNLEYRSMNSLNFFFQRHASAGNTVKQMQAQLESRRKS